MTTKTAKDTYFYISDHLGSASMVLDLDGNISQSVSYIPYGEVFVEERNGAWNSPYLFNAKELDPETGFYYYGARYLNPTNAVWLSVDPLFEKYSGMSPYNYCAGNPVKLVDVDGREVWVNGEEELTMIKNTLPLENRDFVKLNRKGFIDKKQLNKYNGDDYNTNVLREIVNSDVTLEVFLDDRYTYNDKDGNIKESQKMGYYNFDPQYDNESDKDIEGTTISGTSTGEGGMLGKTLFPGLEGIQNSPSENLIVIINKNLSPEGAAENYSHEANGHVLLYLRNNNNRYKASHQPINGGWEEGNVELKSLIIKSKQETIKNMKQ